MMNPARSSLTSRHGVDVTIQAQILGFGLTKGRLGTRFS